MTFYFSPYGSCRCGKPATGLLKTSGTTDYGRFCTRCGEAEAKRRNREKAPETQAEHYTRGESR